MYATLSYDVNSGARSNDDLRQAIVATFADRATCDLLSDTFICEIATTADYLSLVRKLRKIATDFPDQFIFVFTLHRAGAPLRSNGAFSKAAANDIIEPGDES